MNYLYVDNSYLILLNNLQNIESVKNASNDYYFNKLFLFYIESICIE